MGRLPFTKGYELVPEGIYDFKVTEVKHDEVFGVLEVKVKCSEGEIHNKWSYLDNDNTIKKPVMNLISYFAKNVLNDFDSEDFEPNDMLGKWVTATVRHTQTESRKTPGKMNTYANIGDFEVCENPPEEDFVSVSPDADEEIGEMFS